MEVSVIGSLYSIAEVGEQLAWLTTALNLSCGCSGQLCATLSEPLWARSSVRQPLAASASLKVGSSITAAGFVLVYPPPRHLPNTGYSPDNMTQRGSCWTSLFGQLTLVKGYPIPRRTEPETGIEMPLPMLAALVNSQKVATFLGKFLIKGYSTAAIPTGRCDEFIYWHVVSNENGDHLEFSDIRIRQIFRDYPSGLTLGDLEFGRHIVGWCANAKNNTGTFYLCLTFIPAVH